MAEESKKLTQAQKNYLVKRINEIANSKISGIGGVANYGATQSKYYYALTTKHNVNKTKVDRDVLKAIIKGEVRLKSKAAIMATLKDVVANTDSYFNLSHLAFIDLESLEKFNIAANDKIEADRRANQKRTASVRDEADSLKDSVMLDGTLAIELLEKFEKKEF